MTETESNSNISIQRKVLLCHGTGCVSGKAVEIRQAMEKAIAEQNIPNVTVDFTGCHGFCEQGPICIIEPEEIFYTHVTVDDVPDIIQSHLINNQPVSRLFYKDPTTNKAVPHYKEINFYKNQQRIILRNCGHINPERIKDYIAAGGYRGLRKVLSEMTPQQVIDEIKKSGLRGRGGAGFPTATKWQLCRNAPSGQKYMVCNADEGDPGAFMDRSLLEGDPFTVIEGMTIGAYAVGATQGFIYCRAEKPLAIKRVRIALKQVVEQHFLGENIFNSGFNFNIELREGAGAFVCGEETALMASIEGKRGMPNPRPPFPAEFGLWGKPTNINNVKSLGVVPVIIEKGADWYSSIGTEKSKGTAVFALTGKIANSGLVEVPMGTSLYDIIFEIGGGIPNNKRFKAVQTGGPSGGCLPANMLNLPVDYESLAQAGAILGSGGMVVMDEDTCMVDIARFFMEFIQRESCGKCVLCRLGTKQMLTILENICNGKAQMSDIDLLNDLCQQVKAGSLCGLGQTAPNPVLTTLRYFRKEYEDHVKKHHCVAAVCRGIVSAPCSHTCPANIDVPRYVRFIAAGKPDEALAVIREKIPFPSVCGMVCFHPCESRCRRGQLDEAIAIRMLKRFASENGNGLWKQNLSLSKPTGKSVAVIGAGPAGLTAAYYLAKLGHSVTVFEALPEPGGMMRFGIPDYRLPKNILKNDIREILDIGVVIKTNSEISNPESLLKDNFDAVFIASGAHKGVKLGIPGEDLDGVSDCVTFLQDVSQGRPVKIGKKVAIIGGGNAAIDSARTALRLGAKDVTILYRRTREEMPANPEEIEQALEEKIRIQYLVSPVKITGRDNNLELEITLMKLGPVDASGRKRPEPLENSNFTIDFDNIIAAVGQQPEIPEDFGIELERGNVISVHPDTLATGKPGIFAGGDAVTGPASVIEAIAAGRQAAVSIDKYLGGAGIIDETLAPPEKELPPLEEAEEKSRPKMPVLAPSKRLDGFDTVELGYSKRKAREEAKRCLRCDKEPRE
ncbi:MAG: FAD-dependent oxidoreductase [Dehalococcoidales bacterium]|nr:FAD-dependent oxidoreductase [Dehalococcoidales bacterium]